MAKASKGRRKARGAKPDPRAGLVSAVGSKGADVHLVLGWRKKLEYNLKLVETDNGVARKFHAYAKASAEQLASDRAETPYDPEWPLREHEYFALTQDEIPAADLFDDLDDFLNLGSFDKDDLRKPHLYVVAVQTPDGNALFGRRMAYLKMLGRSRNVFAALWDGSTFSELNDSVATFATSFDWVLWQGVLYVLNADAFHAEFRDNEKIREAVVQHVDAIQARITIVNADEFIARCQSSVQMASKLQRVAEDGIWDRPISELQEYAEERGLDVTWTDDDELVFDGSIEDQWSILKLLDEDRTEGPVSGRTFDSAAKRQVDL